MTGLAALGNALNRKQSKGPREITPEEALKKLLTAAITKTMVDMGTEIPTQLRHLESVIGLIPPQEIPKFILFAKTLVNNFDTLQQMLDEA